MCVKKLNKINRKWIEEKGLIILKYKLVTSFSTSNSNHGFNRQVATRIGEVILLIYNILSSWHIIVPGNLVSFQSLHTTINAIWKF
jgi:hypothetical protein